MTDQSKHVADFDSATAMLRATAAVLEGEEFPALGQPRWMKPLARAVNVLPDKPREMVYAWSGAVEANSPRELDQVSMEGLADWVTAKYPRQYPAVTIGSSNGAGVHLSAALRAPFLPQTFLIPVRRPGFHPDEPVDDMKWAAEPAQRFLEANPDTVLHHMHDPNQDRLMVRHMTYFRAKRRRLGPAYERFLRRSLAPGGTIFIVDCGVRWPVNVRGERHYFQMGATGGIEAEEYLEGSERVAEYLERYDSHRRRWEMPEPDAEAPEAEWGFDPALGEDVDRFADAHGYQLRRIYFDDPEDLSPLVADLYRWWYARRGLRANRVLVESFIVLEPYWALRTGSVPYWAKFNTDPSADRLEKYLTSRDPFDDIRVMLFSHGTESAGLGTIDRWKQVLRHARERGELLGVAEDLYPRDFGVFGRYHDAVRKIEARYPLPGPLALQDLDQFITEQGDRHEVEWR